MNSSCTAGRPESNPDWKVVMYLQVGMDGGMWHAHRARGGGGLMLEKQEERKRVLLGVAGQSSKECKAGCSTAAVCFDALPTDCPLPSNDATAPPLQVTALNN
jgi:hypothetical protein